MRRPVLWLALALSGGAAVAWLGPSKLWINGALASEDVRIIDGRAFVPVSDIAKSLKATVSQREGGYDLSLAGGANAIAQKFTGKLGEEVFTGRWRFQVVSVSREAEHKPEFRDVQSWSTAVAGEGEELVVLKCRLKNGTSKKDTIVFSSDWPGINTALTDAQQGTYPPFKYVDVKPTESAPEGVSFLPGSAINFNLVFVVKKAAVVKDLVFTVMRYDMRAEFDQKKERPEDVRISLQG